jgi:DNA-binding SARP family transcriptional activator/tetratricopeptide (TPR) repeat protein
MRCSGVVALRRVGGGEDDACRRSRVTGRLDFRVLGPLEVVRDHGAVALVKGKARAALGVLLIHANEVVATDRLIDDIWGAHPPATATKSVHVYISQLRQSLGADAIVTRAPGYELRVEEGQLDLDRFDRLRRDATHAKPAVAAARLREALGLWRGPPFADFTYDAFAQATIARLEELRLAVLEECIAAELELGRHAELVGELATLAQEHPLRERIRAAQMLALYRSGRQAEALAAYQSTRRALVDVLGIEPGRALHDLERDILTQDSGLDFVAATQLVAPGGTLQPGAEEPREPLARHERPRTDRTFFGRTRELETLCVGLDQAIAGQGGLFLISGEPGIGKSRLIDEFARHAGTAGVRVLSGRCWEAGGAPAYWPWCQSIRAYVRACDPELLAAELGSGAADIAELVPDVRERVAGVPAPARSRDPDTARFRLFDATAGFLRRAAVREPLVLVLDDLLAAETPSLVLLQFLARELAETRILVIAGYRDTELARGSPLTLTLVALRRESVTRALPLSGLARDDVAQFIRLAAGTDAPESLVNAINAQTEGNPLFLGEVVRLLAQEGRLATTGQASSSRLGIPQGVREAISLRLGHLSSACNEILILASILGRDFRLNALERVSELSSNDILELLDPAFVTGLISEVAGVPGRLRFSHALVRETLHEELNTSRRVALHARVGEALEDFYAHDTESHLGELAYHFFESLPGGDAERAIDYARRAGRDAVRLLAYEEAARLYRMALAALETTLVPHNETRCDLLLALGDAEARAGNMPEAKNAFLAASEIARHCGMPEALAHAAVGYGGRIVWARAGHDLRLVALLRDALAGLPPSDSPLRVRLLARLAGALRDDPSPETRAALSAEAVEMARRLNDPGTLAYALDGRYAAILGPENPEERLALADEIVRLADAVDDRERAVQGRHYRLIALMELADLRSVDAEVTALALLAEELRQPAQLWYVAATRANLALLTGRFDEAEDLISRALELGRHAMSRDATLSSRLQLFLLRREQNRLEEVEETIRQSIQDYSARPVFRCALILLLCDLGREDEAIAALDRLAAGAFADIPVDNEWLFCMSFLADASERLGATDHASALYDLLLPHAGRNASNADEISLGDVSRSLGNAAAALERWDDAVRHFTAALDANARMGAQPWLARTRDDYARMLRARGRPTDIAHAESLTQSPPGAS